MISSRVSISRCFALAWFAALALWVGLAHAPTMDLDRLLETPHAWGMRAPLLGTDAFGRDLFAALGVAMRRSLAFSLVVAGCATAAGISLGAWIAFLGERPRFWAERVLDFFLAFPPMLLALGVQAAIGTGWRALGFSVAIGLFPGVVRFVLARAREIAVTDFVEAARALGGKPAAIFWRHYRPALIDHLRLKVPSLLAQALLLEATLSFLNLGVPPGVLSWGAMLIQGKDYLIEAPHIAVSVGIPLVLTLLALQNLADRPAR
jgi:ABC-type dipeptide/oligopeptide/nickel transport system permease subunit